MQTSMSCSRDSVASDTQTTGLSGHAASSRPGTYTAHCYLEHELVAIAMRLMRGQLVDRLLPLLQVQCSV